MSVTCGAAGVLCPRSGGYRVRFGCFCGTGTRTKSRRRGDTGGGRLLCLFGYFGKCRRSGRDDATGRDAADGTTRLAGTPRAGTPRAGVRRRGAATGVTPRVGRHGQGDPPDGTLRAEGRTAGHCGRGRRLAAPTPRRFRAWSATAAGGTLTRARGLAPVSARRAASPRSRRSMPISGAGSLTTGPPGVFLYGVL